MIHGEYLDDKFSYKTILRLERDKDNTIVDQFLLRARLPFSVCSLINKSFVAIGKAPNKVVVLYVHDHSYLFCQVDEDEYEQYLTKKFGPNKTADILYRLEKL